MLQVFGFRASRKGIFVESYIHLLLWQVSRVSLILIS
jgi:hypothetical protein